MFIVVPGYNTTLDQETPANDVPPIFLPMANALRDLDWRGDVLTYGYNGGDVSGGQWSTFPYGCADTASGVIQAEARLRAMMTTYSAVHPDTRYVLVGHSLGGVVAMYHLFSQLATDASPPIEALVTVDAPLAGVADRKINTLAVTTCLSGGGDSASDLRNLRDPSWRANWRETAHEADRRGIAVRTLGNSLDCLYFAAMRACQTALGAFDVDDRGSQFVSGYYIGIGVPFNPRWPLHGVTGWLRASHGALLTDRGDWVARVIDAALTRKPWIGQP